MLDPDTVGDFIPKFLKGAAVLPKPFKIHGGSEPAQSHKVFDHRETIVGAWVSHGHATVFLAEIEENIDCTAQGSFKDCLTSDNPANCRVIPGRKFRPYGIGAHAKAPQQRRSDASEASKDATQAVHAQGQEETESD
jgi:hypothetical protein